MNDCFGSKYSQTPHGELIETRVIPFWVNWSPLDRVFVATMYTSDVDKIMRYTDEVRAAYTEI